MAVEDTEGINMVNSVPHVAVSVYTSKYAKPIKVIAFLDTEAAQTIMNLEFLPQEYLKPFTKHFSTTSSKVCADPNFLSTGPSCARYRTAWECPPSRGDA
ncbi:hypothetical protein CRG98_035468 [Punica granatum]|uniref:Uncharacterized protein n=1 Tax=Punica granatum TaxID=22663 RepID=A0A2I0IJG4_PUNGR|nr:hypothetical protein CRG98_035468 [Punica granatum]